MGRCRGVSLAELVLVLVITGILLGTALPRLAGGGDRWIVAEAREEVIGLVYQARMEARRWGEAVLVVESGGGARVEVPERGLVGEWEPRVAGLRIEVAGARDEAHLAFGPSGTGRLANATLRLHRGDQVREVVISSYGRVRR
jgi:type II secretory pathway pseudopilin PulG